MPSLSCCPSKVPSLLNMALYIWAPTGAGCFHHSFTLSEAGGVWKGNDSDVDVEMGTTGPDPSDLQVKLKLTFNSECGVDRTLGAYAHCGEDHFYTMVGGSGDQDGLPRPCCDIPAGESKLMWELGIWKGTPVPLGKPYRWTPPCVPSTPQTCCPPPGRGKSGTKPPAGPPCCTSGGALGGNVFSMAPIRYASGELALTKVDLTADGFGLPWGHTRSFASRQSRSETIGNGFNWQVQEWPYLVIDRDGSVVVQGRPNEALWFEKIGDRYAAEFNAPQVMVLDASAQRYKLYERDGSVTEFDAGTGVFCRRSDPAGNRIEVVAWNANGYNLGQVERSYTSSGQTTTEQYLYEYTDFTGDQLLQQITLRRRVGSGNGSDISRVVYAYYGDSESYGSEGDLKTVTTQVWDGSQWASTGTSLYRYYKTPGATASSSSSSSSSPSDSSSSSSGGFLGTGIAPPHLLKYVVEPASYERLATDPNVTDPLTAGDLMVSQYADYYFEYDAQRRVTRESLNGGSQTYWFSYRESSHADGYNAWKYKTVETLPDGNQNIVYSNYAGQTMLLVFKSGSDQWCEFWKYNDAAQVILHANPSAISGYDEQYPDLLHEVSGNYEYLRDSDGLIHTFEYHAASGYLTAENIQQGELGTPIKLREYEYLATTLSGEVPSSSSSSASSESSSSSFSSGSSAPGPILREPAAYFTSKETVYPSDTDQTKKLITTYDHTFHADTCQVQEKTVTLPAVPTDQNGSGVAATRKEAFDTYGNLTWIMDERGFITRLKYDVVTGAVTQRIDDVDTAQVSDAPAGWETPTGGGLHLVTDFEHDTQGRITQTLGPMHTVDIDGTATSVRRATWTVYDDANQEVRTASGFASGASYNTFTLINPVSITKFDEAGNVLEQIQATRASTSGKLQASDTFAQSSYVAWTTNQYTECCVLDSTRMYHTIPASGEGESGTHYDQTDFQYKSPQIMNWQKTPGGTITFKVFDARGNPTKVYVGTDDTGATVGDPTGGGAIGNNMVLVTENEYDGGSAGVDGNLTQQTQHVDASTTRITSFTFDWRNRRTDTNGEIDLYEKLTYDNLDRATKSEGFDTTSGGNLIARNETKFDDRGRVYQTVRYGVNPATGVVGNSLTDDTWYDVAGNVIKSLPSGAKLFAKTVYDGLRRRTKHSRGYDLDETAYSDASTLSADTLLDQSEFGYDAASNVIQTTLKQRYHNATGAGELNGPSGTQPKSRITYTAAWHDPLGRTIATADYGTNGGSSLTRPSTVPARSDTVLVTSMTYDSAGQLSTTTNPGGVVTYMEYDAAGRQTKLVQNWTAGSSPSSSSSGPFESDDANVTVLTAYNPDGNVSSIAAVNSITGDQTTRYVYGTTLSDSGIASSLLKRAEIYPDSDDAADPLGNGTDGVYDRIEFKYNRQGEATEIKDQNETVHNFDYDLLGRRIHDRVTTLGSGVDGAVRRISTTYEVRGMADKITSWNGETVGSGSVVNEVQFAYSDFGQITHDYQAHGGTVNTSTTPKVQYGYANGSTNTIRPMTITYPNGRVITYTYGAPDSTNDALGRLGSIVDDDAGSMHLADYYYLGLGPVRGLLPTVSSPFTPGAVEVDYTEPDIKYTLVGTAGGNDPETGDIYLGLDRFGRVKDCCWYNDGTSTDVDRIKYGYDRNGNRLWRENVVARSYGEYFDEKYVHDWMDRLKQMDRGALDSGHSTLDHLQFAQRWGLDATGNWRSFLEDSDGDASWDLDQTRTCNKVNEIADISESAGPSWVTPVYNRAGNMTTIPKPADPTQLSTATYDAWNRLVRIEEGVNKLAEYEYDGATRRTVKKTYISGQLAETRHLYYTAPSRWQVVEERVGSSTNAERQFVWGLRYVDDLILRDRDANSDGTLDERLYAIQDAIWNVISIATPAGGVYERYSFAPYGARSVLSAAFAHREASLAAWERGFGCYVLDANSDLDSVRHRTYDHTLGLWCRRDPLGYWDGLNCYEYVGGRVTMATDPFGLDTTHDCRTWGLCTYVCKCPTIEAPEECGLPGGSLLEALGEEYGGVICSVDTSPCTCVCHYGCAPGDGGALPLPWFAWLRRMRGSVLAAMPDRELLRMPADVPVPDLEIETPPGPGLPLLLMLPDRHGTCIPKTLVA
jgi:RHS repeat-associated protein